MNNLHPGAKWLFRITGYIGAIIFLIIISFVLMPIIAVIGGIILGKGAITLIILLGLLFYIILIIVIAEVYARMAYNRWKYEFTPTNLKIEKGIIWKKYSNIPYERVQNVDIHRGIIARVFGFSTIQIQTAGFSGMPYSEGNIPAVGIEHSEKIREFLMKKITGRK